MGSQKAQGKSPGFRKQSSVPTWIWIFAAVALALIFGSFIANRDSPKKGRGKARGKPKSAGKEKSTSLSHNLKNLELLDQVSDQVSQLAAEGKYS